MSVEQPKAKYLKDYQAPDYLVNTVELRFELDEAQTLVTARMSLQRHAHAKGTPPLILFGQGLQLRKLTLNEAVLKPADYTVTDETLTITQPPASFSLEIETLIHPEQNTELTGLYKTQGTFCTQCEAEGFRRITYFPDRPDVMAQFSTMIIADKKRYPVLLSNGNLQQHGMFDATRHFALWVDPFKKPSYLFALVAGELDCLSDHFVTQSGRKVALKIYVEKGRLDQSHHAMHAVKRAMRWDEQTFNREYDLDIYMIVAVDYFNMGAMENKGLNIFNSKYVLAKPDTATDDDFIAIESVIGHEYFHNWTGNRITCRDWFQLSLKEGLTIFRDQEFTADMTSRPVKRIEDVSYLRAEQFPQDAGPMAHPVRPESYIEMNNFYTVTVYNKGAEVIRMMQTLLGPERFKKGMALYFARHDGQAVTTDDFVKALEDGGDIDLSQFRLWYSQAGTPQVKVARQYNAAHKTYTLTFTQTTAPTPGQQVKKPLHIPIAMGLLGCDGHSLPLHLQNGVVGENATHTVLELTQAQQSFTFVNLSSKPVPSLLRNFSAPVKLNIDLTDDELLFLLRHDTDLFNRWEAGQVYSLRVILQLVKAVQQQQALQVAPSFIATYKQLLSDLHLDKAYLTLLLTLPHESYIGDQLEVVDSAAIVKARRFAQWELAQALKPQFLDAYQRYNIDCKFSIDPIKMGERSFKNLCLQYLMQHCDASSIKLCYEQFNQAMTMTDTLHALQELANCDCEERKQALATFYSNWQHDSLVVNKWFSVQAQSVLPNTLQQVKELLQHPAFKWTNPNNVRAVIGVFSRENHANFHAISGAGYEFLADAIVKLNTINPQVAARLLEPLIRWRRYDKTRQDLMRQQLERILALPKLSKDVFEIVQKSLLDE